MTNINTNISLVDPAELTDEYFLIIEQVEPDGTLVEEEDAAKLVDDIYKTSICDESYEIPICGGSITANARPDDPTEEEVQEAVEELQIPDCEDADGSFETQVKIYRSHQEEDYNLVIEGGEETLRVIVQESKTINLNVKLQNSVEIGYPYVGNVQAVWLGEVYNSLGNINPPSITVSGNVLSWTGNVTGTITISFNTIYDLIDIYAYPPDEDEDGNYVDLLAFYHYEVYTETIEEIVPDDNLTAAELEQLCEDWGGGQTIVPTEGGDCYKVVSHVKRCDCSGTIEESYDEFIPTECPVEQNGGQVGERREETIYVDCNESDNVNDPEYYEEKCCYPPGFQLPECKTKISIAPSDGELSENDIDHYTALYGDAVRFIPVTPQEGYCGVHRIIQDVNALNCCDGVLPILPHPDNPTEITSGGTVWLEVLDGRDPFTWTCSGSYTFSNGTNTLTDVGPKQYINADNPACPNCVVNIDDGCSNITITLTNPDAEPLIIEELDYIVAPGGAVAITVDGGVPPFSWSGNDDLVPQSEVPQYTSRTMLFNASATFCGTASITVSDGCTETDSRNVRSTDGKWRTVGLTSDIHCSINFTGEMALVDARSGILTGDGFKIALYTLHYSTGNICNAPGLPCPQNNIMSDVLLTPCEYCETLGLGHWYHRCIAGCCQIAYTEGGAWVIENSVYQYGNSLQEWVCV